MTRPGIKRTFKPPAAWKTMAVGAVFSRTFPNWQQRTNFRNGVLRYGRENGKRFACATEGLTLTVTRIR